MRVDARAAMAVAILVQFVVILALLTVSWSGASCKGVEVCGGVLGGSLVQSAPIPRWKTSLTISRKPLFQSSRARIECHDVMIDGKRINDWLFVEYPSTVQLLVREKGTGLFVLMKESDDSRYGLTRGSLSSASGQIEPGESPMAAAKRELEEELGLRSSAWTSYGGYRVNVNRGGGHAYFFFADDCEEIPAGERKHADAHPIVRHSGFGDTDGEDLQRFTIVRKSKEELRNSFLAGEFRETSWALGAAFPLIDGL